MYRRLLERTSHARSQAGFTIAELTIASAVFSIVLLTALSGFMQIGRLFYKGVTFTSTQETANQIYQDIGGYFQTASTVSSKLNDNGYTYYCIGGARFTFTIDKKFNQDAGPDRSAAGGNFGILKDTLPGGAACEPPCNDQSSSGPACSGLAFQNPQELLGDKMRVLKFDITQAAGAPNLYNLSLVLAYGDDDVLTAPTTPGDPSTRRCVSESNSQQYCSIATVDAGILRGFQ